MEIQQKNKVFEQHNNNPDYFTIQVGYGWSALSTGLQLHGQNSTEGILTEVSRRRYQLKVKENIFF